MRILKSRDGFSLAEVMIALAIIVIVTAASFSTIVLGVNYTEKVKRSAEARSTISGTIEVFRFAATEDEFAGLLKKVDAGFTGEHGQYTLEHPTYRVEITVAYSGVERPTYAAKWYDADGAEKGSYEFRKGGAA